MSAVPPTTLRVLVADDHRLMLAAVRRALGRAPDLEVVGEVDEATKVIPCVSELHPDVVLLDIRMPELDGLTCLERLRRSHPETAVVILSTFAGDDYIEAAKERGAAGYIVKTVDPLGLPGMVRDAVESDEFLVFRPELEDVAAEMQDAHGLSEREVAIVRAVARGLTNKEIGRELFVSEQTVKFHLRNVYRKLEIGSRAEAARWAIEHGVAGGSATSLRA